MASINTPSTKPIRGEALRQGVLDAAERLLGAGRGEFAMRELAAEAGVSFATPFNQFGSKAAIMQALSGRRIETMAERFAASSPPADAVGRVLLATAIAVGVMREAPAINRIVMGWIGAAASPSGRVLAHSSTLWAQALGEGVGLAAARRDEALRSLPGLLAFGFRGVLSFWTAGELSDEALALEAANVARALMAGFSGR